MFFGRSSLQGPVEPPERPVRSDADPFIREKFIKERSAARKAIREYYKRFPNKRYQTELESWRHLQSQNFEFVMKRLREPIDSAG
jgi:hypothetical protein